MPLPDKAAAALLDRLAQQDPERLEQLVERLTSRRAAKLRRAEMAAENARFLAQLKERKGEC